MTDGFALKSWVISLFNKASKKNNKYSTTEETVIGTWIDGKPVYRKVIRHATTNYDVSSLNIDNIVSLRGVVVQVSGNTAEFGNFYDSNNKVFIFYSKKIKQLYYYQTKTALGLITMPILPYI